MLKRIVWFVLKVAIGVGILVGSFNFYHDWVLKSAVENNYFTVQKASAHFVVYGTTGSQKTVNEYSQFLEGYLEYINQEYVEFAYDYPIKVYIWPNEKSFNELKKKLNLGGAMGFFSSRTKSFYTFDEAGYGTLTHELMHPLMQANFPNQPKWTEEGIPTFFEKFFGYWKDDKLYIKTGYQNPWRIGEVRVNLKSLNLEEIIKKPSKNQSELRLASVFLAKKGLLKEYLQLLKVKDKKGYSTYYEAAFEKDFKAIEPYWREYLEQIAAHDREISRIPPSRVFHNIKEYAEFSQAYNLETLSKY